MVLMVGLGLKVTFFTGFGRRSAGLIAVGRRGVVSEGAVDAIVAMVGE